MLCCGRQRHHRQGAGYEPEDSSEAIADKEILVEGNAVDDGTVGSVAVGDEPVDPSEAVAPDETAAKKHMKAVAD